MSLRSWLLAFAYYRTSGYMSSKNRYKTVIIGEINKFWLDVIGSMASWGGDTLSPLQASPQPRQAPTPEETRTKSHKINFVDEQTLSNQSQV